MSNPRLEIDVIADIRQITRSLADLNKRIDDFAQTTGKSIQSASDKINGWQGAFIKVGLVVQQAAFYIRAFSGAIGGMVADSNAQEQALAALRNAMMNTGAYSRAAIDDLQAYAAAMQKVTVYGDEQTLQAAAILQAMTGLRNEGLKPLIKATMDFASAKRMDLAGAAELIGKTIGSETNALSRYGIAVNGAVNSQERLRSLLVSVNQHFKDQAEAVARTDAGRIMMMTNSVGDLKEVIGDGLKTAFRPFADLMIALSGGAASAAGALKGLVTYGSAAAAGLAALALKAKIGSHALKALKISSISAIFTVRGLSTALKSLNASLGPVGWAILGLTAAYEGWIAIKDRNVRKTQEEIDKQRELKTAAGEIANIYDVGQLRELIAAKKVVIEQMEQEISALTEHNEVASAADLIRENLNREENEKSVNTLEEKVSRERQLVDVMENRLELLNKAGIAGEQEARIREELARLEARNAGKEIAWLKEKLTGMGDYKALTTEQKIEYQKLQKTIEDLTAAEQKRQRAREDLLHSTEYRTLIEKESYQEAREAAEEYYRTRIEEARKAGDIEQQLRYTRLLTQIESDKESERSAREKLEVEKTILREKINAIKGNTDLEIDERERLKLELRRLNGEISDAEYEFLSYRLNMERDADQEWADDVKRTQDEIAGIITGGGYSAAYETVIKRLRQKMVAAAVKEVQLAEWVENSKFALKEAWAGRSYALAALFSGKNILLNAKEAASNLLAGLTNLFKSVMKIPFPGNLIAFAAGGAAALGLLSSFKKKGNSIVKAAEGALIDKPTLALVGEAISQSGPELITPMKTFKQVVNEQIVPEISTKLSATVKPDNRGVEERLERIEKALQRLPLAGDIAGAVVRNFRGRL